MVGWNSAPSQKPACPRNLPAAAPSFAKPFFARDAVSPFSRDAICLPSIGRDLCTGTY
jgi:hypothetical protein